jgi:hypothetical protein
MSRRTFAWLVCAFILHFALQPRAQADAPPKSAPQSEFEKIITRIRTAAATDEWKQPGWKDESIEAACKQIIESSKTISGDDSLSLPLEFKEIGSPIAARGPRLPGNVLLVSSQNADVPFASKSIFLIDGSIHISHASDCIVIACGAVEISHANHCLIVAGHHIDISHDGNGGFGSGPGGERSAAAGSILISGGSAAVSHAAGTVCCAPVHVDISHANKVRFIASPNREISHQQQCQVFDKANRPLLIPAPRAVSSDFFTVKQVVSSDDKAKQLVSVERNGLEYVLRPGNKIVDEKGQPITLWNSWKVGFITENFVLFTDGQDDISVRLK